MPRVPDAGSGRPDSGAGWPGSGGCPDPSWNVVRLTLKFRTVSTTITLRRHFETQCAMPGPQNIGTGLVLNRELRSHGESTAARVPASASRRAEAQRFRRVADPPLALAPPDRGLRADFLAVHAQE